ncbi:MAG: hypothetical protein AABY22_25360 [Nanoarchaeota archaeon]
MNKKQELLKKRKHLLDAIEQGKIVLIKDENGTFRPINHTSSILSDCYNVDDFKIEENDEEKSFQTFLLEWKPFCNDGIFTIEKIFKAGYRKGQENK